MRDRFYAAVAEYESILDVIAFYERGERHGIAEALKERYSPLLTVAEQFTENYHLAKTQMHQAIPGDP